MSKFDAGDDNVQGSERFFPLQPAHSALARQIQRMRVFQHQTFVPPKRSLLEEWFELNTFLQQYEWRNAERRGPLDTFNHLLPFHERLIHETTSLEREKIED